MIKAARYGWLFVLILIVFINGCDDRNTDDDNLANMQGELTLEEISDSEIRLSWQSNSQVEDHYLVERAEGETSYTQLAEVNPDQTVFRDTALTVGVYYRYRVSGIKGNKQTNYLENSVELSFVPLITLNSVPLGVHSAQLLWSHDCDYATGYRIERKETAGGVFEEVGIAETNSTTFIDTTARPDISLTYKVTAFTQYNQSNSLETVTYLSFPSPENFHVTQQNVNEFILTWEDASHGEDNYIIERRIDSGPNTQIAVLDPDTIEYIDSIEQRDQIESITWWIKGVYSEYQSNTVSAEIDVVFPEPHIEIIEAVNLTSARIEWEDNSIGETGFRIDRRLQTGNWVEEYAIVEADQTEWIDENIEVYEEYYYQIYAFSTNNISDESNLYYYQGAFPSPDGLVYEIETFGEIRLNWNDNCDGEEGYRLDRRILGEEWQVAYQEFPANTETFTDVGLTSGMQISYRIYAYLGEYESNDDMLYNIDVVVDPPEGFYFVQDNLYTISLIWIDNISGEEGYKIDREVNSVWTDEYATVSPNEDNFTDNNVPVNSTLRYRIYAFAGDFNGETSTTDGISTYIPAPGNLYHVVDGINSLSLYWDDTINGEDGFYIDKYTPDGGWQQQYGSLAANADNFTDNEITYGSIIRYRVYAYYGEEIGAYAETEDIEILLPAPENLQWERAAITAIDLSWDDVINGEDNYIVDRKIDNEDWTTEFAILQANTSTWQDNDLELGDQVTYRVYARTSGNDGADAETEMILIDFPAPQNFNVDFSAPNQLDFSWELDIDGIDGLYIESYDYVNGWQVFVDNIPNGTQSWTANGDEWGIYRITAWLGSDYEAHSIGAGVAAEGFSAVVGGSFQMGDQFFEGDDDELPLHMVNISGFYVAQKEVTQAEYEDIMDENPSSNQAGELPVENLGWYQAVAYCNELSYQEALYPCYNINGDDVTVNWDANGYRLLTEAEWEFAARGGIYAEDNFRYSGSDDLSLVGWYDINSTQVGGGKAANQLGIYDMSGNVWEMCWDYYDDGFYSISENTDPTGAEDGFSRVTRGGAYNSDDDNCRVANRYHRDESYTGANLGFRICRRK